MNPLTLVKRIQKINSREAELGISDDASWHAKYKESAYVFVGGIPFDLTEGDLLAVFAQYGEIVDVNLVRDKATGKSKGFAFVAYEDQRSTNLAVDNLNGASVLGRIVRVDHVSNYKKKEEEDEEKEQQKREARGVCRAFQKGECNRGAACKFSHNEQRCANTGWGPKDDDSKWEHNKSEGPSKSRKISRNVSSDHVPESQDQERVSTFRSDDKSTRISRAEDNERDGNNHRKRNELNPRDQDRHGIEKWSERYEKEPHHRGRHATEKRSRKLESQTSPTDHDSRERERSRRDESEPNPKEDHGRIRAEKSRRHESEPNPREDRDRRGRHESEPNPREDRDRRGRHESEPNPKEERDYRGGEKRSRYERDSSSHRHDDEDEIRNRRSNR